MCTIYNTAVPWTIWFGDVASIHPMVSLVYNAACRTTRPRPCLLRCPMFLGFFYCLPLLSNNCMQRKRRVYAWANVQQVTASINVNWCDGVIPSTAHNNVQGVICSVSIPSISWNLCKQAFAELVAQGESVRSHDWQNKQLHILSRAGLGIFPNKSSSSSSVP